MLSRIFVRMKGSWLLEPHTWKWFLFALLVRGACFWIFLHAHGLHQGYWGWGCANGDTASYFDPIDAHLAGDAYRPDMRMPGYGFVYLLLRWFTTPQGAGSAIILLQLLLSALSTVAVMRIGIMTGLNRTWQRVAFWTCALCLQVAYYDVQLLSESFCISALIFCVHDLLRATREDRSVAVLTAGVWLTWAIFLRPVFAVLLPVALVFLWRSVDRRQLSRWGVAFAFLIPFLVVDGWWTARNWRMHHRMRPLANSFYYPWSVHHPIFNISRYVRAYGGNHTWWDPSADIRWFNVREGPLGRKGPRPDRNVRLPAAAVSEHCTVDSLRSLGAEMAAWSRGSNTPEQRLSIGRSIEARVDRYIAHYRGDRPFAYHVFARIRMLGHLLVRSGQEPLFEPHKKRDPPGAGILESWNDIWYWLVMPAGLLMCGLVLFRWRSHDRALQLLVIVVGIGTIIHPVGLRLCQGRYLVPMLPFLTILAVALLQHLVQRSPRA